MPIRDKFPAEYFDSNPFEGETPQRMYERLQWGNKPKHTWQIEAPEPMAVLGRLAKLKFAQTKTEQTFRDYEYYVAVGASSNWVYLVPIEGRARPASFPLKFLARVQRIATIKRIDYYSEKGQKEGYYFHDHEPPYPVLMEYLGHYVLAPASHRSGRSYAVGVEGIIG